MLFFSIRRHHREGWKVKDKKEGRGDVKYQNTETHKKVAQLKFGFESLEGGGGVTVKCTIWAPPSYTRSS